MKLRPLFFLCLILLTSRPALAQTLSAPFEQIANQATQFADLAIAQSQTVTSADAGTVKLALKQKLDSLDHYYSGLEAGGYSYSYDYNVIQHNRIKAYNAYFIFLTRAKDQAEICRVATQKFAQFNYKDHSIGFAYEKTANGRVKTYNVSNKEALQLACALSGIVILAANHEKQYELRDKYFNAGYAMSLFANGGLVLPYTTANTVLSNYDPAVQTPFSITHLRAAIVFLQTRNLKILNKQPLSAGTDTPYYRKAKSLLLATYKNKIDTTVIPCRDFVKGFLLLEKDSSTAVPVKLELFTQNFENYKGAFNVLNHWNEYDPLDLTGIFREITPDLSKAILQTKDGPFLTSYIDFVSVKKNYIYDGNKDHLYDVYLYCKNNGKNSIAKAIYKVTFGESKLQDKYPK